MGGEGEKATEDKEGGKNNRGEKRGRRSKLEIEEEERKRTRGKGKQVGERREKDKENGKEKNKEKEGREERKQQYILKAKVINDAIHSIDGEACAFS